MARGMLSHLSSMSVQSLWILEQAVDPEHPKHAHWVTYLVSLQSMEVLGHFQLPGIVYRSLQHWAMHCHAETGCDGGR